MEPPIPNVLKAPPRDQERGTTEAVDRVQEDRPPPVRIESVRLDGRGYVWAFTSWSDAYVFVPLQEGEGDRAELSPREVELFQRIVDGETEAQIAGGLYISPHTVRTHDKNIYKKLQVHSRAAAVRVTLERGLLDR